jgi:hypothetical protein
MFIKFVVSLNYRWMILSEDGLLKTPKDSYGSSIFNDFGYDSKEEAIKEYQRRIDLELSCPDKMVLVEEYEKDYVW